MSRLKLVKELSGLSSKKQKRKPERLLHLNMGVIARGGQKRAWESLEPPCVDARTGTQVLCKGSKHFYLMNQPSLQ